MTLSWGSGPLADAARRLAPEDAEPPDSVGAGDHLAAMLDLPGSVTLAERLADWNTLVVPEPHPEAAEHVAAHLERLDRVERRLEKLFGEAFKPRYGLPRAGSMYRILEATGALELRKGAPLARATRSLWSPVGQFWDAGMAQARRELGALRETLGFELGKLGEGPFRLEAMATLLGEATSNRVLGLTLRMRAAIEARFAAELRRAVRALPEPCEPDDLSPWLLPDGWVPGIVADIRLSVLAYHDHHRNLIEALADACAHPA